MVSVPRRQASVTNSESRNRYAALPIEGTQIVRQVRGPNEAPGFAVRCCCGYRAGPWNGVEAAEAARALHADACHWPKP
ncbi:hypothetical protein GCM10009839_85650 [Catenulispora yoronensis]|uniref:Uncharacterized protein n=1 Tax=Catenulispora yoronensis TaxID=450799 RepID=A0ABN2VG28_9ACTN